MFSFLFDNPQKIVAGAEILGFAILGILAFSGIFSTKNKDRRNESDKLADGLINRLKETLDQQAKDMTKMSERIDTQQKEIHHLQGQNEAYLTILSLRDPATAKVFEEAPEIFTVARETNEMVHTNNEVVKELTKSLTEFINTFQPLVLSMKKQ